MTYVSDQTKKGMLGEKTAANMFRRLGYKITPSTSDENRLQDIDGYLEHIPAFGQDVLAMDGAPISIKNEEEGFAYKEVYFEVSSHVKNGHRHRFPDATVDGWIDSILMYSKAKYFVIIQPTLVGRVKVPSMLVIDVEDVRNRYLMDVYNHRAKVLSLSAGRKVALAGDVGYPFDDAMCYYMKRVDAEELAKINIT